MGALGSLGSFGQATGFKGTMSSIKGVVITGTIAAGGAIITDKLYEKIGASLELEGWKRDLAKIVTGLILAIGISKLLKKPKLAAAFAIGPVVAGVLNIFGEVMAKTETTEGLGLTAFQPVAPYQSIYAPMYGVDGVNTFSSMGPGTYPAQVPPAPQAKFNAFTG